ncbi:MAG: hypothetical protein ABJQ29_08395 [Luteolibacter sp.]
MNAFLITCTQATCAVPEAQRELFRGSEDLVHSTAGWEPGSLNLAQGLAMKFSTPLIHGDVTRLLIDLDQESEKRWSDISLKLPEATREKLVERHEKKFRNAIEARLAEDFKRREAVVHFLIHTAPIADGTITFEHTGSAFAQKIATNAEKQLPSTEVNSSCTPLMEKTPFIRWLLESNPDPKYGIIRITVSQSFFMKSIPMRWETIKKSIIMAIYNATQ